MGKDEPLVKSKAIEVAMMGILTISVSLPSVNQTDPN